MLTVTTPAAVAAISTADAKSHLRITHSDEDTQIDTYVSAAAAYVSRYLGRALTNTTFSETLSGFPTSTASGLYLSISPLSSVTSIKYYDESDTQVTWSSDEYDVHTPEYVRGFVTLTPAYTWPTHRTDRPLPIEVSYVAGYGTTAASIPVEILQAVYLILDDMYRFRGASVCMPMSEPIGACLSRLLQMSSPGVYP